MIIPLSFAQRCTVQEKFYLFGIRHHIDRFHRMFRIVPMPNDIRLIFIRIHPSVPHHLMSIKCILRNTQRIGHSTPAIIFGSPIMRIRIRKDNLRTATAYTQTRSRPFAPIVVPTAYNFYSQHILIMIIVGSRLSLVQRSFAFLMVRIAVFIPILAQAFITTIFRSPHRMFLTFVDVQHFASIFRFIDIQHFT